MRGYRLTAGFIFYMLAVLALLLLLEFHQMLSADGDTYIASGLNTHLQTEEVQDNKGRIVDRDNLAWHASPVKAVEMLALWKEREDAIHMLDSFYHILYDDKHGIANLKSRELFGRHKGVFSGEDGINDLYRKKGHDIYITVSGVLNEMLYRALKESGAEIGEAILTNYKTGEILAWTSISEVSDGPALSLHDEDFLAYTVRPYLSSRLALPEDLIEPGAGPFSSGQGADNSIMRPYYMSIFISAVANNGKVCKPYIISRIVSREDNEIIERTYPDKPGQMEPSPINITLSKSLYFKILMKIACRENGTAAGLGAILNSLGYTAAARTGTAEVLQSAGGRKGSASWIACFLEERPFALVVAAQDVKIGSSAEKIASEALSLAIEMNLDSPQFTD